MVNHLIRCIAITYWIFKCTTILNAHKKKFGILSYAPRILLCIYSFKNTWPVSTIKVIPPNISIVLRSSYHVFLDYASLTFSEIHTLTQMKRHVLLYCWKTQIWGVQDQSDAYIYIYIYIYIYACVSSLKKINAIYFCNYLWFYKCFCDI